MITNEVGWGLGTDGKWYCPYVEVDGQWVRRTDVEWVEVDRVKDEDLPPDFNFTWHREWAAHLNGFAKARGRADLRHKDVSVTLGDWEVDPQTGFLQVRIQVRKAHRPPLTEVVQFHAPPLGRDIEADLLTTARALVGER